MWTGPTSLRSAGEYSCNTIPENRLHPGLVVPAHIDQVFSAVLVVEEGRIEAAAVEVNRIRPLAVDARTRHQVVVCVTQ